jgi:hypothetical protein
MNRRERILLLILVAVALVSLPFLPFWGSGGSNTIPDRSNSTTGRSAGGTGGAAEVDVASFPRLDKELLAVQPEKFEGALRNLFTFSQASSAQPAADAADDAYSADEEDDSETGDATQASESVQPARQQLTDYEYLGYVEREGVRYAAFFWRGRYFTGVVGDTINETFEIKSIEKDFALIYVIGGDFEQRLKLNQPAGDTDQGEDS